MDGNDILVGKSEERFSVDVCGKFTMEMENGEYAQEIGCVR